MVRVSFLEARMNSGKGAKEVLLSFSSLPWQCFTALHLHLSSSHLSWLHLTHFQLFPSPFHPLSLSHPHLSASSSFLLKSPHPHLSFSQLLCHPSLPLPAVPLCQFLLLFFLCLSLSVHSFLRLLTHMNCCAVYSYRVIHVTGLSRSCRMCMQSNCKCVLNSQILDTLC